MALQANSDISLGNIASEFGATLSDVSISKFYDPRERKNFYSNVFHDGNGIVFINDTIFNGRYWTPNSNIHLTLSPGFVGNLYFKTTSDGGNSNLISNICFNTVTDEEILVPSANDYVRVNFSNITSFGQIGPGFEDVSRNVSFIYLRSDNTDISSGSSFILLENEDPIYVKMLDISAAKITMDDEYFTGNNYELAHGGDFVSFAGSGGNQVGIVKDGKSIQFRGDIDTLSSPDTTYLYVYFRIFLATERDGEGFPGFYNFGSALTLRADSNPSYINDGTYTNTADSVASLITAAINGGIDSGDISGLTFSASKSGTTVTTTITNNTGSDYFISFWSGNQPFIVGYNSGGSFVYTSSISGWGSPWETQQYGSPHTMTVYSNVYRNDFETYNNTFNTIYFEHGANTSNILLRINEDFEATGYLKDNSSFDSYKTPEGNNDPVIEYVLDSGFMEVFIREFDGASWSNVSGLGGNAVGNVSVQNFSTNRFGNNNANIEIAREYRFSHYYEAQAGPGWIKKT